MMKRVSWFFILFFISFWGYSQYKISVLFVGNSLTYFNNLPEIVKKIAAADSTSMEYKMLALPNYALTDHLTDGNVVTEIKSKKYDFVVVQQGPSSQTEGRTVLINDGLKFSKLCSENNSKLAFYTVWPSVARSFDFPGVIESYRLAAETSQSILCPAGDAWFQLLKTYPDFKLYSDDNFHPSYSGSLLAAFVIYGSLLKKNSFEFAGYTQFKNPSLSKSDFTFLKRAAQKALEK